MPHGKVACGRFLKPFGVSGELKFQPFFPDDLDPETLASGIVRHNPATGRPDTDLLISSVRRLGNGLWALKPDGCDSPEEAALLTNAEFWIDRSLLAELGPGEYLAEDILGCRVADIHGNEIGILKDIYTTGANDIWALEGKDGKEILIPAIADVIREVDTGGKRVVINVLEGLLD